MTDKATTSPKCQRCGTPLAPDAPEGLCPRCLMALNLASQTEATATEAGPGGTQVVPAPPLPLEELARLFPQLEILECLGRGGMGVVYKARQPRLDRLVALKVISPGKEKDPHFAERFAREARALAHLNHQSIVTIYDFGEAGGLFYLLMEYVDGTSLRSLLQARRLAPDAALKIVPAICEALQYAHQQGVVHRDIKPENILLDKQGRVKIADFGIAKVLGGESPAERLTGDRQVVGTPNYMAPEQVEKPASVDHRADIYSLGVVFYEMLTGELPLGKFQPPSNKVHIDVRLDEIVLHALEKEPERRYQQAVEVKTALDTLGSVPPRASAASAPPLAADPWAQVHGPATGLIVTAILNWVAIPFIFLLAAAFVNGQGLAKAYMVLIPVSAFLSSAIMLLAGLKMKGLEAWSLALAGSVLAMLVTPGNLVGLPVGIWSLVVLSRRETRQAFADRAARRLGPVSGRPAPGRTSGWNWAIAAGLAVVLFLLAIPVGAVLLSIALPAYHKAKAAANREAQTSARLKTNGDAVSGQPFAGASATRAPSTNASPGASNFTVRLKNVVRRSSPSTNATTGAVSSEAPLTYEWRTSPTGSNTAPGAPITLVASVSQILRVAADGSGTHTNLQDAIDAARSRAVIHIAPGRYDSSVIIDKPLSLIGEGWNQTVIGPLRVEAPADIQRDSDAPVLVIKNAAPVLIEKLKFVRPGVPPDGRLLPASVIQILGGMTTLRDCAIVGSPGNGVSIGQGATVTVTNCLVAAAWNTGIRIDPASTAGHVEVLDSDIRNCYYAGLTLGIHSVEVRRCRVSGSAWHGIRYDGTSPTVEECLIFANARSGIYASGLTSARIRENVFWKNEMNGLSAWFNNHDVVQNNTFAANRREGLAVLGASMPMIRQNIFWSNPIGLLNGDVSGNSPSAKASGKPSPIDCLFWTNGVNVSFTGAALLDDPSLTNRFTLASFNDCVEQDPRFRDPLRGDFSLPADRSRDAGALHPLSPESPWPLQPEEKAMIPDGDSRDSRAWKREPATPRF